MALLVVILCFLLNCFLIESNASSPGDADFTMTCNGDNPILVEWAMVGTATNITSRNLFATLSDESCNSTNYGTYEAQNNYDNETRTLNYNTKLQLNISLTTCGTTIAAETNTFAIKNTAILKITDVLSDGNAEAVYYYEYNIACEVPRSFNLSVYNNISFLTDYSVINITKSFNKTSTLSDFNFEMAFYEDESFTNKLQGAQVVGINDYIYTSISKSVATTTFKFVVQKCSATTTATYSSVDADIFFDQGCRLDNTFDITKNETNIFSFKIQTFSFIQEHLSVFFHCDVYICQKDNNAGDCLQQCQTTNQRQRRSVGDALYQEVFLTSKQIVFNQQVSCSELSCPLNSMCYPLKPASCICDEGYAFSVVDNSCIIDRHVHIKNIHLNQQPNPTVNFRKLAVKYERLLYKLFQATGETKEIEGVKVVGTRKGNTILDIVLIHAPTSTPKAAYASLLKSISTRILAATNVRQALGIIESITPSFEPNVKKTAATINVHVMIMGITIGVLLFVILILILKFGRFKKARKEVTGSDNAGMEIT